MRVTFDAAAWADYLAWAAQDPKVLARINALIEDCRRTPFTGTGKPDPYAKTSPAGGPAGSRANIGWCTG